MGQALPDYEVLLLRSDGTLSVVMKVQAFTDDDARAQARLMLRDSISNARIWRGNELVDSVYRFN